MPHSALKFLFDVRRSCDLLAQFTAGKTLDDYLSDALLRSAVERQFEIVGEALSQALRIVHQTVWGILEGKLPALRAQVSHILDNA